MCDDVRTIVELSETPERVLAHGTAVALDGRAVLIVGASGRGKSALALSLMAFGARLVADDRVIVQLGETSAALSAPPEIRGRIEARHVGILAAEPVTATLALVIDLDRHERDRLPPRRTALVGSLAIPCLHAVESAHFPAAILQYLRGGRYA